MRVSVTEHVGEPPQIMSVYHALTGLEDTVDLFEISALLLKGCTVRIRRHGVPVLLTEVRTLPAPTEEEPPQGVLPGLPALRDLPWCGDHTVHLELDIRTYCNAPTPEQAIVQVEETLRCLVTPRPDFRFELDHESLQSLLTRLSQLRTPRDLAAAEVFTHKMEPLETNYG